MSPTAAISRTLACNSLQLFFSWLCCCWAKNPRLPRTQQAPTCVFVHAYGRVWNGTLHQSSPCLVWMYAIIYKYAIIYIYMHICKIQSTLIHTYIHTSFGEHPEIEMRLGRHTLHHHYSITNHRNSTTNGCHYNHSNRSSRHYHKHDHFHVSYMHSQDAQSGRFTCSPVRYTAHPHEQKRRGVTKTKSLQSRYTPH